MQLWIRKPLTCPVKANFRLHTWHETTHVSGSRFTLTDISEKQQKFKREKLVSGFALIPETYFGSVNLITLDMDGIFCRSTVMDFGLFISRVIFYILWNILPLSRVTNYRSLVSICTSNPCCTMNDTRAGTRVSNSTHVLSIVTLSQLSTPLSWLRKIK